MEFELGGAVHFCCHLVECGAVGAVDGGCDGVAEEVLVFHGYVGFFVVECREMVQSMSAAGCSKSIMSTKPGTKPYASLASFLISSTLLSINVVSENVALGSALTFCGYSPTITKPVSQTQRPSSIPQRIPRGQSISTRFATYTLCPLLPASTQMLRLFR